jgi:putative membrane protein
MKLFSHKFLIVFFKGITMGIADLIPGVSGGTIAFITGIYYELINTINSITLSKFRVLLKFEFSDFWKSINGNFIISLTFGVLSGILIFSSIISFLLTNYSVQVWSFFFGIVISGIFILFNQVKKKKIYYYILILLGIFTAFSLSLIEPSNNKISLIYLFLTSMIAIIAMILPGISGALIFILFGVYEYIIELLNKSIKILLSMQIDLFISIYSRILVIILGMIIGLKVFSKILKWLFLNFKNQTIFFLIGIMIGSLPKIWPWKNLNNFNSIFNFKSEYYIDIFSGILFMTLGFLILIIFDYYTKKEKVENN